MFVLIALAAAEVALVRMTFTKWNEKPDWRRNRTLVRLIEAALVFGIVLLPITYMKWRFLIALVVLIVRFLIAGMLLIAPPADGSVSPIRFYGTLGVTVFVIYAAVMLMLWLQIVRQSRQLTQQLLDFQNGQTE